MSYKTTFNTTLQKHILVWVMYISYYGFLVIYFYDIPFSYKYVSEVFFYRIGDICYFYANALLVLPSYLKRQKIPQLIFSFTISIILYLAYRYFLDFFLFVKLGISLEDMGTTMNKSISLGISQGSNFIIFSLGYYFAQRAIQQQKEIVKQKNAITKKELELAEEREKNATLAKEKAQAEMAFLRSQINPHFMFNTLNMIYSKVRGVSREAGDIIIEFADMMRYATSTKLQEDEVDLKGELDFIQQYLSLHEQRNKGNAYIDYDAEGYFGSHRIVPMVLITLIENAIKHGLIDDPNFPLNIRASLIDEVFVFIVHNLKNPHSEQIMDKGNTGIGIKNIIKRLDAVYKNKGYSLESENGEEDYIVTFTVDFNLIKK